MNARTWTAAIVAGLLLLGAATGTAAPPQWTDEVTDYGRNNWRTHYTPTGLEYPRAQDVRPIWEVPLGLSRSQPLILQRDYDGDGKKEIRIYHLAGDTLWALNGDMVPSERQDGQSVASYRQQLRDEGFILWSTPATAICRAETGLTAKDELLAQKCSRPLTHLDRPFASSQAAYTKGEAVADDVIYAGYGYPPAVAAIRATDGKMLGAFIIDPDGDRGIVAAPLVFPGDTVVAGTTSGDMFIIKELKTGIADHVVTHIGGRISSSPVPLGTSAFIMASDARNGQGYMMAYDVRTGTEFSPRWTVATTTQAGIPGEAAIDDQTVYFADKYGKLYALRLDTGEMLWCRQFPGLGECRTGGDPKPAFINNGPGVDDSRVYFVFRNNQGPDVGGGQIVALDKGTGNLEWQQAMEYKGNTAPVPLQDIVIVGDTGGYVQAYNKVTGEPAESGGYPLHLSDEPYQGGTQGERWWEPIGGTATQMSVAAGLMVVGVNSTSEERTILKAYKLYPLVDLSLDYLGVPASADSDGFEAVVQATCRGCTVPITTNLSLTVNGVQVRILKVTFTAEHDWTVKMTWESGPMPADSTIPVVATVDPANDVEESDETNNTLRNSVRISGFYDGRNVLDYHPILTD